jgi:hypothetical protein
LIPTEVVRGGHPFSHLITFCGQASTENCLPFPGVEHVQHRGLPDSAAQPGDE